MTKYLFLFFLFLVIGCKKKLCIDENKTENALYKKAWFFLDKNQSDSAFYYLNLAKDDYLKHRDSFSAGKCLVNMAIIQEDHSDNFGSLETSMDALAFFKEKNKMHHSFLATNYNNLGVNAGSLEDYKQSEYFYRKALSFTTDPEDVVMFLNNYATTLHQAKKYKEAQVIFEKALAKIDKTHFAYPRLQINLARTKSFLDKDYNPTTIYNASLEFYTQQKDLWGQDASYAYLSDYYMKNNPNLALEYAYKMLKIATEIDSPKDRLDALYKIVKLEDNQRSKFYFEKFHKLDDSLHTANLQTKNQYALVRYDTEKNKADKLKLQKENVKKKYELILHKAIIGLVIALAFAVLFWFFTINRKKQIRLDLEAKNKIKEHDLRTSKKVHDIVANGLYRMMTEIENHPELDRDKLLYKLENMYEKSRNISYEHEGETSNQLDFKESVYQLIQSFDSEDVKIFIVGNSSDIWVNINAEVKNQIHHILQEIMVNMKKHSHASRVILKFSKAENTININYVDNGIGMDKLEMPKNGLLNTGNRIRGINGRIIFDTETNIGLRIHISFPEFN